MRRSKSPQLMLIRVAGLVASLLMTPLVAQSASYTYIDQRPPYTNPNPPWLTALSLPRIGTTLRLQVPTSCRGVWDYLLLTGIANPSFDLGPLSRPCNGLHGVLYTTGEILVATPNTCIGFTVLSFPIPNSPALVGVSLFQQVAGYGLSGDPFCDGVRWDLFVGRGGHAVIGT